MTKNEALQMALEMIEFSKHERRHVRWAIKEALCEPSIAQSIRDAAIGSLEVYELEWLICQAFEPWHDWVKDEIQCRTFMLLVAEALE